MFSVETPLIPTEKVICGRTVRVAARLPAMGDTPITLGATGAGAASGLVVGVGRGSATGPRTRARAPATWGRPNPDCALWPPATSGLALPIKAGRTSSGLSSGRTDRSRAPAPLTWGVAIEVPSP